MGDPPIRDFLQEIQRRDVARVAVVCIIAGWLTMQVVDVVVATETKPSIAVLPFVNMSDDSDNEYFSDGLSEELLNVLAKIPQLHVAGRTSSFKFKDTNEGLRIRWQEYRASFNL